MTKVKRSSNSNWLQLKSKIPVNGDDTKAPRRDLNDAALKASGGGGKAVQTKGTSSSSVNKPLSDVEKAQYIGLDCEMVGIGSSGKRSVLARACLVNFDGKVIYDSFVRPQEFVTDFRTKYSGVRKQNLRKDETVTLLECQRAVTTLLKDKILVGHALKNDLDVLLLSHRRSMIRDTATYHPYMRPHGKKDGKFRPRALRELTKQFLNYSIQEGEHDPGEDARAAMNLYKHKRDEWESSIKQRAQENKKKSKAGAKPKVPKVAKASSSVGKRS
jgi:RNA exonuclease 4